MIFVTGFAAVLVTLIACEGGDAFLGSDATTAMDTGTAATASPSSTTTDSADTDAKPMKLAPSFWSLAGELVVTDKGLDLAASTLQVHFWNDDAVETCLEPTLLLAIAPVESKAPKASSPLLGWYGIEVKETPGTSSACPGWAAGTLEIGLGPYDSRLDAVLDERGILDLSLYSLFVRGPVDPAVYLVGVAGTAEMLSGEGEAAEKAPLPPAAYVLESLILLDLVTPPT